MSALLALLMRPTVIAGLAAALLLGGAAVQTVRLNHAKADQIDPATRRKWKDEYNEDHKTLVAVQANLTVCRGNEDKLTQAIDQQNTSIKNTAQAAKAGKDAAEAAVANARKQNVKLEDILTKLQSVEPKRSDLCGSADDLIRTFAQ